MGFVAGSPNMSRKMASGEGVELGEGGPAFGPQRVRFV